MTPRDVFRITVATFCLYGMCSSELTAEAMPIQFGSHYYDFVTNNLISWQNASNAAAASSFMGVNGHLATVMSAAENNFLSNNFATFTGFAGAWLGGQVNSSNTGYWGVGPEAGQPFSQGRSAVSGAYANWGGIEPNNAPSCPYMNIGTLYAGINTGQWADAANGLASGYNDPVMGYFVEYEFPVPAPILSVTVTNSTCQLSWTGLTNVTYAVQVSTNLETWAVLGAVTATQTNVTFNDPTFGTLRFYRLWVP
jgi:hypothetical protein